MLAFFTAAWSILGAIMGGIFDAVAAFPWTKQIPLWFAMVLSGGTVYVEHHLFRATSTAQATTIDRKPVSPHPVIDRILHPLRGSESEPTVIAWPEEQPTLAPPLVSEPNRSPVETFNVLYPDGTREDRPLTPEEAEILRPMTQQELKEWLAEMKRQKVSPDGSNEVANREQPATGLELTDLLTQPSGAKPLADTPAKCNGPQCGKQQQQPRRRGLFGRWR